MYGNYKAKVDYNMLSEYADTPDGKLVLVTAISPTPAGEGKTTTTVGLTDALKAKDINVMVALREPSLGPVFGVKGGAAGGGYALGCSHGGHKPPLYGRYARYRYCKQPHSKHALTIIFSRVTLLAWMLRKLHGKRVVDMNDRQLRNVIDGIGGRMQGRTERGTALR